MTEPYLWEDAACRGKPQRWWFPPLDALPTMREMLLAEGRKVCQTCPAFDRCFDWSMQQTSELHGLWAGLTPRDRMIERRSRRVIRGGSWSCDICGETFADGRRYAGHTGHCRRRLGGPRPKAS